MTTTFLGSKAAAALGGALLAGFAVMSAAAWHGARDRSALERFGNSTAVGDPVVFRLPPPASPPQVALTRDRVPLYVYDLDEHGDGSMKKAGHDDSGQYPLYRRWKKGELREGYYLKAAPGEYFKLSTRPPKGPVDAPSAR